MPYCIVPWTGIDIAPNGDISPCCKFTNYSYTYPVTNITRQSIDDYLNSPILKEVKKDFLNNQWPKGCNRCDIEERNAMESKRLFEEKRWKDYMDNHQENGFLSASVAFGNTCNLSCIICDPKSSSKWYEEYKKLYGFDIRPNHFYKEGFIQNFITHTPNLKHLDIPGGEPLVAGIKQQKELYRHYINEGKAKDISLHYTTNCTIFPDDEWIGLWKHFKEVEVQLSIDGIEERFEYLRYPGKWSEVSENALKYQTLKQQLSNFKLSISTTVSVYNIAYLDELIEWCLENNFEAPWLGRLHNPLHLRPTVWKMDAKKFLLGKLRYSPYRSILKPYVTLLETVDDSNHFDEFRYRLLRHDNYRGNSFKQTFPEMFEFLRDK